MPRPLPPTYLFIYHIIYYQHFKLKGLESQLLPAMLNKTDTTIRPATITDDL